MRSFRFLTALIVTGLLLSSAPQQAVPQALAKAGPARPATVGVAAPGAAPGTAPVARPRGIPSSSFVPASLRAAPRLSPAFTPPTNNATATLDRNTPSDATSYDTADSDGDQSFPSWQANDNNPNTFWRSQPGEGMPQQWCTDFGASYQIAGLDTLWGDETGNYYDFDYTFSAGPDFSNLTLLGNFSSGAEEQTFDPLDATAKVACITITGGNSTVAVKEFDIVGELTLPKDQGSPTPCEEPEGPPLGGPFNPRTGFLWTSATDLQLPSSGLALDWTRTYVSRAITETTAPLGIG